MECPSLLRLSGVSLVLHDNLAMVQSIMVICMPSSLEPSSLSPSGFGRFGNQRVGYGILISQSFWMVLRISPRREESTTRVGSSLDSSSVSISKWLNNDFVLMTSRILYPKKKLPMVVQVQLCPLCWIGLGNNLGCRHYFLDASASIHQWWTECRLVG